MTDDTSSFLVPPLPPVEPPPPPAFPLQIAVAPQPQTSNGLAIASMILGITSIFFCWWGLFTLAQVVLAVVFGGVGISKANNQNGAHKGMAIAGLSCGLVGFIAYLIFGIASAGVGFLI